MKINGLIDNFAYKKIFKSRVYELSFEEKAPTTKKSKGDEEKVLKMIA